jgi:hypothetical protein
MNSTGFSAVSSSLNGQITRTGFQHIDTAGAPTTLKLIGLSANPSSIGAALASVTVPSIICVNSSSVPEAVISFQHRGAYTNGTISMIKPVEFQSGSILSGSAVISGSITITGSAYGNIVPLTINGGNTASMDLSSANFFTLGLVSGSTTNLTATNIKPGQTINLLVTQPSIGTGSISYNSTFKFTAGANYIATTISGSQDIVTFISYDTTKLYATSINNLA